MHSTRSFSRALASLAAVLVLVLAALAIPAPLAAQPESGFDYPAAEKVDQMDVYHGVEVADPYRWLEEDIRESDRVRRWVEAENELTFDYLAGIPERSRIEARITELWNVERVSAPSEEGGRTFFTRNDGLQNQSVVYVQDSPVEEPRVLFDPNGWSDDGTVALAGAAVSRNGRYAAYATASAGSDWQVWRVREIDSGTDLPDEIQWTKFTGTAWTEDNKGFFYSGFPAPAEGEAFQSLNTGQRVFYHRLGTPQADDVVAYEDPDHPDRLYQAQVTEDGRYLVISMSTGTDPRYRVLVRDLEEPYAAPRHLVGDFDFDYQLLGNDGETFYFKTDKDAPRGRIVALELGQPGEDHWREIVPQSEDTLRGASMIGNLISAGYLADAKTRIFLYTRSGERVREVELPGIGTAFGFGGDRDDTETYYTFTSFTTPASIYHYDVATGESTLVERPDVDFDPGLYEVSQHFYTSADGTRVPLFVAHKKGLELDGSNPTLLYGYGGFNVPLTPTFSAGRLAWMEMGGVFALANIRGGGEYGAQWHEAGTKLQKQNVFDDFIAAAEFLIAKGYTRTDKLAIQGGSNGGLLVGAVMTQRPDLFGAALPAVGVMDMLRFHRFTAGRYWVDDYGSADDPEEFEALYAYSPYHNLDPGVSYPATLVTTADTDDRVVPGHSFKFAARLQEVHEGDEPVLIRIETAAGHGGGTPTSKIIEQAADQWAFLVETLDFELPEDYPGGE
jgi:prolyl oligopeptidase